MRTWIFLLFCAVMASVPATSLAQDEAAVVERKSLSEEFRNNRVKRQRSGVLLGGAASFSEP